MDAQELSEWIAFYNLQDEEYKKKIRAQVESERSDKERSAQIRGFLQSLGRKRK